MQEQRGSDQRCHRGLHPIGESRRGIVSFRLFMAPVVTHFDTGVHLWGQFLKDYRPTAW